VTAFNLYY